MKDAFNLDFVESTLPRRAPSANRSMMKTATVAFKESVKRLRRATAQATRRWRTLPDYLIIGTQKGGTSSLYNYLCMHPDVASATMKEIHYFSHHMDKGEGWYRGHFATEAFLSAATRVRGRRPLSGETSPDYLFNPYAAGRAFQLLPEARLLVLLRDPVDRAFSHYRHRVRKGLEERTFEAAIAEELELAAREGNVREGAYYESGQYAKRTYVTRGLYARQLQPWFAVYPRHRFLLLRSEDFFTDPRAAYTRVVEFLGLEPWQPKEMRKYNFFGERGTMPETPRRQLQQFFEPHNRELAELTGIAFGFSAAAS
jgi:hypothetical protein